jgi:hypothetical protein
MYNFRQQIEKNINEVVIIGVENLVEVSTEILISNKLGEIVRLNKTISDNIKSFILSKIDASDDYDNYIFWFNEDNFVFKIITSRKLVFLSHKCKLTVSKYIQKVNYIEKLTLIEKNTSLILQCLLPSY